MDLADKPCYPITPEQYYAVDEHPEVTGLTFRERLIISLASNPKVCFNHNPAEDISEYNLDANADEIIQQADAIINQLTKE